MDKRKALGRGLGALIPNIAPAGTSLAARTEAEGEAAVHQRPAAAAATAPATATADGMPPVRTVRREFFLCPIEEIAPSRDNPRQRFDEQRLGELADSIKAQGLVQPLVVRLRSPEEMQQQGEGPSFELIAGERRWRAAQRAGLKDVPVVVREVSAAQAFELALVENLQREDLSAIEEAEAYRRLSEEFGYTQEQLAMRVGRARETVANSLRLLRLPDRVREQVATGALSAGHARTLLGLDDPSEIERGAEAVLKRHLSVRQTEDLVRRTRREQGRPREKAQPQAAASTPAIRDVEDRLQKALGTRVQLRPKDKRAGHIEVHYHSLDELDRLIALLTGERDEM
ncbi:MAG: ParB/RepB/Spo0J family partition protein [Polyangia bacterium]